ncbi:aminoglycoside phosphotransferase family protein [Turneriella parva]|uniref:Aminoglycoside phosphotransferase n=1 Tax=Turneriella parva (strain ATCC BAA-1111 / DSM 21527 / NCTC 11395 / H) TaxID=869212 RepID=I4B2Z0_TURPD|nr:phosphotransferase [Turneriella parva]AFM11647.1 aminoglycoside phosphotransferase [Turneriella parva DSM 21527]
MNSALFDLFSRALAAAKLTGRLDQITPLVPEASTRRYYRLHLSDKTTRVAVNEDTATASTNMPNVIAVQRFLHERGVAVPEIYFADPAAGIMLQQDLGDLSLNQALKENSDKADLLYQEAILHMLSWQRLADDGHCPAFRLSFDIEKLMFEFEFFLTHTLLGYYHAKVTDTELSEIRAAFTKIAEQLAAYPNKVFTHRDYHSRNIIVYDGSAPHHKQYIIDFQDARMGLMQYDLCSLLCDAYAPLSVERRATLIDFAFEQGKDIHRQTRAEFDHYWQLSAFQRTVKAMGTFGRQAALGRDDFAGYLKPAWQMLKEITAQSSELRSCSERLENLAANASQNVLS